MNYECTNKNNVMNDIKSAFTLQEALMYLSPTMHLKHHWNKLEFFFQYHNVGIA